MAIMIKQEAKEDSETTHFVKKEEMDDELILQESKSFSSMGDIDQNLTLSLSGSTDSVDPSSSPNDDKFLKAPDIPLRLPPDTSRIGKSKKSNTASKNGDATSKKSNKSTRKSTKSGNNKKSSSSRSSSQKNSSQYSSHHGNNFHPQQGRHSCSTLANNGSSRGGAYPLATAYNFPRGHPYAGGPSSNSSSSHPHGSNSSYGGANRHHSSFGNPPPPPPPPYQQQPHHHHHHHHHGPGYPPPHPVMQQQKHHQMNGYHHPQQRQHHNPHSYPPNHMTQQHGNPYHPQKHPNTSCPPSSQSNLHHHHHYSLSNSSMVSSCNVSVSSSSAAGGHPQENINHEKARPSSRSSVISNGSSTSSKKRSRGSNTRGKKPSSSNVNMSFVTSSSASAFTVHRSNSGNCSTNSSITAGNNTSIERNNSSLIEDETDEHFSNKQGSGSDFILKSSKNKKDNSESRASPFETSALLFGDVDDDDHEERLESRNEKNSGRRRNNYRRNHRRNLSSCSTASSLSIGGLSMSSYEQRRKASSYDETRDDDDEDVRMLEASTKRRRGTGKIHQQDQELSSSHHRRSFSSRSSPTSPILFHKSNNNDANKKHYSEQTSPRKLSNNGSGSENNIFLSTSPINHNKDHNIQRGNENDRHRSNKNANSDMTPLSKNTTNSLKKDNMDKHEQSKSQPFSFPSSSLNDEHDGILHSPTSSTRSSISPSAILFPDHIRSPSNKNTKSSKKSNSQGTKNNRDSAFRTREPSLTSRRDDNLLLRAASSSFDVLDQSVGFSINEGKNNNMNSVEERCLNRHLRGQSFTPIPHSRSLDGDMDDDDNHRLLKSASSRDCDDISPATYINPVLSDDIAPQLSWSMITDESPPPNLGDISEWTPDDSHSRNKQLQNSSRDNNDHDSPLNILQNHSNMEKERNRLLTMSPPSLFWRESNKTSSSHRHNREESKRDKNLDDVGSKGHNSDNYNDPMVLGITSPVPSPTDNYLVDGKTTPLDFLCEKKQNQDEHDIHSDMRDSNNLMDNDEPEDFRISKEHHHDLHHSKERQRRIGKNQPSEQLPTASSQYTIESSNTSSSQSLLRPQACKSSPVSYNEHRRPPHTPQSPHTPNHRHRLPHHTPSSSSQQQYHSRHEQQQQRDDRGYSNYHNRRETSDYVSASPARRVNMNSIFSPAKVLSGGGSDRVRNLRGHEHSGNIATRHHQQQQLHHPHSHHHHSLTSPMAVTSNSSGMIQKSPMWPAGGRGRLPPHHPHHSNSMHHRPHPPPHSMHRPHPSQTAPHNPYSRHPQESKQKCVPLKPPIPSKFQGDMETIKTAQVPDFTSLVNFPSHMSQKSSAQQSLPEGMKCCVMCGRACPCSVSNKGKKKKNSNHKVGKLSSENSLLHSHNAHHHGGILSTRNGPGGSSSSGQSNNVPIIPTQNKGLCTNCDVNVWVVISNNLEIKWCKGCKNFRPWAAFGDKGLATKCVRCRDRQREKYAAQKEEKERSKQNSKDSKNSDCEKDENDKKLSNDQKKIATSKKTVKSLSSSTNAESLKA